MAMACTETANVNLDSHVNARRNEDVLSEEQLKTASARRLYRTSADGSAAAGDADHASRDQRPGKYDAKEGRLGRSHSGMGSSSTFDSPRLRSKASGPVTSEGSCSSDLTNLGAGSPMGLPPYSPFMMFPRGPPIPGWQEGGTGSPAGMPGSPMSPGSVLGHPPFGSANAVGAPGSPHSRYPHHNSSFVNSSRTPAAPSPLNPGLEGPPSSTQLPPFYLQAAAATAATLGPSGPFGPHLPPGGAGYGGMGNGLSSSLDGMHSVPAYLSAYSNSPMGLEQQLSQAAASLTLDGLGGSLPTIGSMPNPGSAAMAAAILQQQHYTAAALRRSFGGHPSAATLGLAGAGLGLPHLQQMAALQHMSAASASALPLGHHPLSRLRQSHSAEYPVDMGYMHHAGRQHSRFKPRRSSEPKIGPDGQPRLNARQRRTLRRAKERALKGLMEASVSLLNVHGVKVELPQDSHLTAVMAAADKEAEQAEDAGYDSPLEDLARDRGTTRAATQAGSAAADDACRADVDDVSRAEADKPDCVRSKGRADAGAGSGARARDLAVAADELETSVRDLALAAVAAVAAVAEGKDISQAAVAAQQAAAAAVTAASVLPAGYTVPDEERMSEDGGGSQFMGTGMPTCGFPPSSTSSSRRRSDLGDAPANRVPDAKPPSGRNGSHLKPTAKQLSSSSSPAAGSVRGGAPGSGSSSSSSGGGGDSAAAAKGAADAMDIERVIDVLQAKGKAGAAEDKLIRDLQIIQSLIGALKAPMPSSNSERSSGGKSWHRGHHQRRSGSAYGGHHHPHMMHPGMGLPH